MKKLVSLMLVPGSFEQGFAVTLRIFDETGDKSQAVGSLPPSPTLAKLFLQWEATYQQVGMEKSRIKPKPIEITNISQRELGIQLVNQFNNWLNSIATLQLIEPTFKPPS